jgi:glucose-1-phosphate thymidylyltransferase
MDAIVLVGGYAERLWPLTLNKPKSLLKIMAKEILSHVLDRLKDFDKVEEIIISTSKDFKDQFANFLDKNGDIYSDLDISIATEPLGKNGRKLGPNGGLEFIRRKMGARDYIIISGDNIFEFNLSDLVNFYEETDSSVIALQEPTYLKAISGYGLVEVDENNKILKFEEKPDWPRTKLISTGCYILKKEDFELISEYMSLVVPEYIRENEKFDDSLGEFMKWLVEKKKHEIMGYRFTDAWFDIGTLDTLLSANKYYLKHGRYGHIVGNTQIEDPVHIGEDSAVIDSIIGPDVYIGKNCLIRKCIISDALVYDNVTLGDVEIHHSVVDEGYSILTASKVSGILAAPPQVP